MGSLRRSLRPILLSSWIVGVPNVSWKYSYRILYSSASLIIFLSMLSASINDRLAVVANYNGSLVAFHVIAHVVATAACIGTYIFWVATGAKALDDAINETAKLDVKLENLDVKIENHLVFRRQIILLSLFLGITSATIGLGEFIIDSMGSNVGKPFYMTLCIASSKHLPGIILLIGEIVFSTIMFTLYQRFALINEILRNISRSQELLNDEGISRIIPVARNAREVWQSSGQLLTLSKIKNIYDVHQEFCKITENVNSSFSWLLYWSVLVNVIFFIYGLIFAYSIAYSSNKLGIRIALVILNFTFNIVKFWILTINCNYTTVEANKFARNLHEIEMNSKDFHEMLHDYSIQLFRRKLKFTAGDFFSIDSGLITTLISYVTTYLLFATEIWRNNEKKKAESAAAVVAALVVLLSICGTMFHHTVGTCDTYNSKFS